MDNFALDFILLSDLLVSNTFVNVSIQSISKFSVSFFHSCLIRIKFTGRIEKVCNHSTALLHQHVKNLNIYLLSFIQVDEFL